MIQLPSPVTPYITEATLKFGIQAFVKRDDLIHPFISGNKYRKLKYTMENAKALEKNHLVTLGGAYSNHILATAYAANLFGFTSTGIIRGEELDATQNAVLRHCTKMGMQLIFVDRTAYRDKAALFAQYFGTDTNAYFIDEGGNSDLGCKGVAEMITELPETYDQIWTACGTACTLAGICNGISANNLHTKAVGVAVLKNAEWMMEDMAEYLINSRENIQLLTQYAHNGYAKSSNELLEFIENHNFTHNFKIEPVYTGKLFYAFNQELLKGNIPSGSRVLLVHTGGVFDF